MLAHGVGFGKRRLCFSDSVVVQMSDQTVGGLPGLVVCFADDHVQANAEAYRTAMFCGFSAYLSNFLFHQLRWLAPGQIEIDLLSRQLLRHVRRSAEIEGRARLLYRREVELCIANVDMFPFEGDGFPFQQTSPDAGELCGGFIALGMIEKDAIARQLLRIAARHQVEQRTAVGKPVQRCRLTRRDGGRHHARAQGYQEFQALGDGDH